MTANPETQKQVSDEEVAEIADLLETRVAKANPNSWVNETLLLRRIAQDRERLADAKTVLERVKTELIDAGKRQGIASLVPHTSIFKSVEKAINSLNP